jgi:hypothetical protein
MIDSDDLYGPMEVGNDLSTALGTETLADRDIVSLCPQLRLHPGFLGRYPAYKDLRAPEVAESRAQCQKADRTGEECPGR